MRCSTLSAFIISGTTTFLALPITPLTLPINSILPTRTLCNTLLSAHIIPHWAFLTILSITAHSAVLPALIAFLLSFICIRSTRTFFLAFLTTIPLIIIVSILTSQASLHSLHITSQACTIALPTRPCRFNPICPLRTHLHANLHRTSYKVHILLCITTPSQWIRHTLSFRQTMQIRTWCAISVRATRTRCASAIALHTFTYFSILIVSITAY